MWRSVCLVMYDGFLFKSMTVCQALRHRDHPGIFIGGSIPDVCTVAS